MGRHVLRLVITDVAEHHIPFILMCNQPKNSRFRSQVKRAVEPTVGHSAVSASTISQLKKELVLLVLIFGTLDDGQSL
jgi:hypothetical protein